MERLPLPRVSGTGPGYARPDLQRTCPGNHQGPGPGGLRSSVALSAHGFLEGSKTEGQPGEARSSLEDLRRRLAPAFQRTRRRGASGCSWEAAAWASLLEMQRRARVESALAWLRCELLEMRFENRQLTRTLLDLSLKMEHFKKEYEMEIAVESQCLETNAMVLEKEMYT
ncbi:alanine and arginine-rich domain-containing protein [Sorex fumeus]|uniref:alanine and arginine-rich domain-containing protein n=1 Tax=Sorex fumeus TaxID=62283 RepID=UPI0024AE16C3|nr:alanine and arginine-rich domain-containing protein [Sorex fumeus]